MSRIGRSAKTLRVLNVHCDHTSDDATFCVFAGALPRSTSMKHIGWFHSHDWRHRAARRSASISMSISLTGKAVAKRWPLDMGLEIDLSTTPLTKPETSLIREELWSLVPSGCSMYIRRTPHQGLVSSPRTIESTELNKESGRNGEKGG